MHPVFAQNPPKAILADGAGPWRDDRWASTVTEFSRLLSDAGYTVTTVSPVDLPSVLRVSDVLVAVPSLESLPFDTFSAVVRYFYAGGSLMASGGEPFRDPLYLTPDGKWLDFTAYQQAVGSPPPQGPLSPPYIETLSPWYKQYTNRSGFRVPIARPRGLINGQDSNGRYRVIGDLLAPAATMHVNFPGSLIVWIPSPELFDPFRIQVVAALHAVCHRAYLLNAGPPQIVWLPGEHVTVRASFLSRAESPVQPAMLWSIAGSAGVTELGAGASGATLDLGPLPNGDYTVTARLMVGNEEVDRIDSTVRVLDPSLTRQPDQKIRVVDGAFYAGGRRVFLHGVNYWPRYLAGAEISQFNGHSWLDPNNYDADLVEADLSLIASLNFNLVNIQYFDLLVSWNLGAARSLIDFLERCRNHGIWVRLAFPGTLVNNAYTGNLNPALQSVLEAAYLPGNDRVFAYEPLWEPFVGSHDQGGYGLVNGVYKYNLGRLILDADWRNWVNDQYGSLANAEQIWGLAAPRDAHGQLTNPLDDQIANDGPWRIMVAAYRRFADDYFGRNLGVIARAIRRIDSDTLISYRNGVTMSAAHNLYMGYDIGTAAAHVDFFSPERYGEPLSWPDDRSFGLVTAYSRYRTGGKPVQWSEFGYDIGAHYGTVESRATQATFCDTVMRQVNDDGSNAASVWWWPGGWTLGVGVQSDFGIIDPDGTPRDCALTLAQWGATFAATPPDQGSGEPVILTVDRDSDARGSYGLFLSWQSRYTQARQDGNPVILLDQGTGTDTSTMPLIQVGNAPYAGVGPLKFVNAELGGIRVVCPDLDATVENGAQVQVPAGATCQIAPTLVNTGEAQWLPSAHPTGGVILHTNLGDIPLTDSVPSLQRIALGPLTVNMGQSAINLTGRLKVQGVGVGEVLNVMLTVGSTVTIPD
jgi:hypothetical protein